MINIIPVEKNKEYTLNIERLSSEGSGVAHYDGFTVFVPQAAPGDTVSARIVKVKSGYAYARVTALLTPSPLRREPVCERFGSCGGCQLMHMSYEGQLEFKKSVIEEAFLRIGGIELKVTEMLSAPEEYRYRNKMVFPVGKDRDGKISIGFFRERSHDIIPIDDCRIGDELIAEVLKKIQDFAEAFHISVYDEAAHTGLLRRVFVRTSAASGDMLIVISVNGTRLPHSEELITALTALSARLTGIVLNINTKRTNLVLGEKNTLLWGKGHINDSLCGLEYEISPHSFFQINPAQTERLYAKALELAAPAADATVLDVYCGIGTISLALAKKAKKVIGIEIVEQAIKNARENARKNKIDNAEFYIGDAQKIVPEILSDGEAIDVVVLDPPRKGSDKTTLSAIINAAPKRIVYVSCNPSTLARDTKFLSAHGYYPSCAFGVDMFPQTVHVECVVLMTKVQN